MLKQKLYGTISKGHIIHNNPVLFQQVVNDFKDGDTVEISLVRKYQNRTEKQNRALHLYFELIAEKLNDAGLDMRLVLPRMADIPWSRLTVKELLWRPLQEAQLKKQSTTELETKDIDLVLDTFTRFLATMGVQVDFPSEEEMLNKKWYGPKNRGAKPVD